MATPSVRTITEAAALLASGGEGAERAAGTLRGISLNTPATRDAALRVGVVAAMLPYMRAGAAPELLRVLTQTFSNLCRRADGEPAVPLELVSPALSVIKDLLSSGNQDVLVAACTALINLTHGANKGTERMQAVPGLTARLVALLREEKSAAVKEAALGAVANMLAGTSAQVDHCLEAGCLGPIISLLESSAPSLALTAARAVSNIFAETHPRTQQALDEGVLTPLKKLLDHREPECRMQAAKAIANLCYFGGSEQRAQLVAHGVLQQYCAALQRADEALAAQVLAGLHVLVQSVDDDDDDDHDSDSSENPREREPRRLLLKLVEFRILDLIKQLLQRQITDQDLRSQAQELSATVRFYVETEDIILEDGKEYTALEVCEELKSVAAERRALGLRCARRLASLSRAAGRARLEALSDIMEAGEAFAPLLGALDQPDCPDEQLEAARAVTDLTYERERNITTIVNGGGIPKLVSLLAKEGELAEQAALALGNIASRSSHMKEKVLEETKVRDVLPYVRPETPLLRLRAYVALLQQLLQKPNSIESLRFASPVLPFIPALLKIGDQTILVNVCLALESLFSISNESRDTLQAVAELGARLAALLGRGSAAVRAAALRALNTVLEGSEAQTQRCLDAGCAEHITTLLRSEEDALQRGAVTAATTIVAGTSAVAENIAKDILVGLRDILPSLKDDSRKEVVSAIESICHRGTGARRDQLVWSGALRPYCELVARCHNEKSPMNGLFDLLDSASEGDMNVDALRNHLKEIGVKKLLEDLSKKDSPKLSQAAADALKKHSALLL